MTSPLYPDAQIELELEGPGGNAFSILGRTEAALIRAGVPKPERLKFHTEAMSGDYDHLLATVRAWVTVDEA